MPAPCRCLHRTVKKCDTDDTFSENADMQISCPVSEITEINRGPHVVEKLTVRQEYSCIDEEA